MNWGQLTMKIKEGNKEWCLKGNPTLFKSLVSLKSMMRTLKKGGQGFLLKFGERLMNYVTEE